MLPSQRLEKLTRGLEQAYGDELKRWGLAIELHGPIYPGEFVLTTTVLAASNLQGAGTTLMASVALGDAPGPSENVLLAMLDRSGSFLESYLALFKQGQQWEDYRAWWEEESCRGVKMATMVSRDNVRLSLAAHQLLHPSSELVEDHQGP